MARLRVQEILLYVLGSGANLLVHDAGVAGAVICLDTPEFKKVQMEDGVVTAGAGKDIQKLVLECTHAGSFRAWNACTGTPGSVGGEIKMNAGGAFGDIGSAVKTVTVMDRKRACRLVREKDGLVFEYRHSNIMLKFILDAQLFNWPPDDPKPS